MADTKIIAEAWDAAGGYQVGTFGSLRWAEWNGHYRDDLRRFWRGDPSMVGLLATRMAGSSDLYQASGRQPYHSINFITSHDGFTLNDLVSYSDKHNEANGEENRDGEPNNYSYNYGAEGPTPSRPSRRSGCGRFENLMASLLLSQGVPMLWPATSAAGPKWATTTPIARTTRFPGSIGDWSKQHRDLWRFCRSLVAFRRSEPTVRQTDFLPRPATPARRIAGRELVRPQRRGDRLGERFAQSDVFDGGGRAGRAARRRPTTTYSC